ncbi:MAG: transglycosylase SLT domain-containing protein [Pseudomonadales bacterium]|nr:transglycosylase SLT domain-containing protein [Pseudomonadales bacterium]
MQIKLKTLLASLLLFMLGSYALASENFPRPLELEADVNFWTRVYTEISTQSGFVHDAHDLSIVYETIKTADSSRTNRKKIRAVKAKYIKILNSLVGASRANLNAEQQRVLQLWGEDVSDARLRSAATSLRFQKGQSDRFLEGLVRSGTWRSHIEKVLAKNNLPKELVVLPHVESSFNPRAYSRVGASGLWQFTRATGRRYMRVDYVVDERMDPFVATIGAARLLEHNRQLTGTWPLSLTAYNHGAASIRRATKKLGTKDIGRIVREYNGRAFGFASRNFYVAFLAALEIDQSPEKYFGPYKTSAAVRYTLIQLDKYYAANTVARALGTNAKLLRKHNPALLAPVWNGSKRIPAGFTLRVPADVLSEAPGLLLAQITAKESYSEQTPDLFHKVVRGDTISEIAARYGYRVSEVLALNSLSKRNFIRIGQELRLPVTEALLAAARASSSTSVVKANSNNQVVAHIQQPAVNVVATADKHSLSNDSTPVDISGTVLAVPIVTTLAGDPSDYTVDGNDSIEVQASETLGHYAEWLNIRARDLRRINDMPFRQPVVIGRRIKLDFSKVSKKVFEQLRLAYQHGLQQAFFMSYQIQSVLDHPIRRGESLWLLSQQKFKVPVWLLRQYNPDLNFDKLKPGLVIKVPILSQN